MQPSQPSCSRVVLGNGILCFGYAHSPPALDVLPPCFPSHPAGQKQSDADHLLKEAIASLHAAYFAQGPYQSWKAKSNVRVLDKELKK